MKLTEKYRAEKNVLYPLKEYVKNLEEHSCKIENAAKLAKQSLCDEVGQKAGDDVIALAKRLARNAEEGKQLIVWLELRLQQEK